MNTKTEEKCAGYISLVFFDEVSGEAVNLGGAGFLTDAEFAAAWANVPEFAGKSNYQADRLDAQGDIVGEKTVDVVTCEKLTGKPITTLILEGRAKLAAELASYRNAA
jgi:hypothetical protein